MLWHYWLLSSSVRFGAPCEPQSVPMLASKFRVRTTPAQKSWFLVQLESSEKISEMTRVSFRAIAQQPTFVQPWPHNKCFQFVQGLCPSTRRACGARLKQALCGAFKLVNSSSEFKANERKGSRVCARLA